MFRALNTELEDIRNKVDLEKTKIEQFYNTCMEEKKYTDYFNYKIAYEENTFVYEKGKEFLMFYYVDDNSIEELEKNVDQYNFMQYQSTFFSFLYKLLHNKECIKVEKYLKYAEKNEWYTFEYFDIFDRNRLEHFDIPHDKVEKYSNMTYTKPFK